MDSSRRARRVFDDGEGRQGTNPSLKRQRAMTFRGVPSCSVRKTSSLLFLDRPLITAGSVELKGALDVRHSHSPCWLEVPFQSRLSLARLPMAERKPADVMLTEKTAATVVSRALPSYSRPNGAHNCGRGSFSLNWPASYSIHQTPQRLSVITFTAAFGLAASSATAPSEL